MILPVCSAIVKWLLLGLAVESPWLDWVGHFSPPLHVGPPFILQ